MRGKKIRPTIRRCPFLYSKLYSIFKIHCIGIEKDFVVRLRQEKIMVIVILILIIKSWSEARFCIDSIREVKM